jgi:hypothetical protein
MQLRFMGNFEGKFKYFAPGSFIFYSHDVEKEKK